MLTQTRISQSPGLNFCQEAKERAISPKRRETCASSTLSSIISGRIAREIRSMMPYFRARMIAGANAR